VQHAVLIELNLPDGSMHTVRSSRLGKLARARAVAIALHNYAVTPLSISPALRSAALRIARCVFASARMRGKLIPSAAQPRNRVGIHRRRTMPVKAATPRAATAITLRDARDISFKLPFAFDPECI